MVEGIILKGIGGFYYVNTPNGIYECKARGLFRKEKIIPAVGDKCIIDTADDLKGSIEVIKPRKNLFVRPPIANADNMFIVFAHTQPSPVPEIIDKLTVIAAIKNVKVYIIENKTDLSNGGPMLSDIYERAGFKVFKVSAATGSGVDELLACMENKISVLTGCSGVGKSSLLNSIFPEFELKTGSVSEKISRGRHTTREVELIALKKGGYIADSPGFSSLEVTGIDCGELEEYFPEFKEYIQECRYRGCSHINEPECGVKNALNEEKISESRYKSYTDIYEKLKEIKKWQR